MGRRPLAQKRQGKAPTATSKAEVKVKGLSGGVEKQPESSNPSSEKAILEAEKPNPETIEAVPETQSVSAKLSPVTKANKRITGTGVRKSQRLQYATTSQDKDMERIIGEITMSESEKDEGPLLEEGKLPEPVFFQKSLEEKVEYLLQQFEEQQKTIEAIKFKITRDSSTTPTEIPDAADVRYKTLYFESQKKIEALEDENHQLALRLERALGKLDAYEKGAFVFSESLGKMKDMVLITNLTRTETAVNISSQSLPPSVEAGAEAKTKTAVNISSQSLPPSVEAGAEAKTTPKRKKLRGGKQTCC